MSALCQLDEVIDFAANGYDHTIRSHHVFKKITKSTRYLIKTVFN